VKGTAAGGGSVAESIRGGRGQRRRAPECKGLSERRRSESRRVTSRSGGTQGSGVEGGVQAAAWCVRDQRQPGADLGAAAAEVDCKFLVAAMVWNGRVRGIVFCLIYNGHRNLTYLRQPLLGHSK
jgi:hypothetical protein